MLLNHLRIAWRNLTKNLSYSLINIGGLAIGITACMLILQYVSFEFSYEDFHEKKDRIYRVKQDRYDNGELTTEWASGSFAVGGSFKNAIPEIEEYVKVIGTGEKVVDTESGPIKFEKAYYVSDAFFKVFTYPLILGNSETALVEPNTAAISRSMAKTVYGDINVLGKSIMFNGFDNYRITGVFDDMPDNTQLKPDVLLSNATRIQRNQEENPDSDENTWWRRDGCLTYFLLKENADAAVVESKFPEVFKSSISENYANSNSHAEYFLEPLTELYLYSNYMGEPGPTGDGQTTYMLLYIALFIIIIAWINYINLATARAISRAKEVGIRKSIGSRKTQLVTQFLVESALCNGLALLLAIGLTAAVIPSFNQITGHEIGYEILLNGKFWLGLVILFLGGIILSGSYPAFVLSRYKPIEVLKGKLVSTKEGGSLRKSLVVFQFAASLFLLIGTFTVYYQIDFMNSQKLGVDIEKTIVLPPPMVIDSLYLTKVGTFKETLTNSPLVKTVTTSTSVPGEAVNWNAGGIRLASEEESEGNQYRVIAVDAQYLEQFNVDLVAGRGFSDDFGTETSSVIFNKAALKVLGIPNPEEALDKVIHFWGEEYTIVGVMENFHQESLKKAYEPLILKYFPNVDGHYSIKTEASDFAETLALVETEFHSFFPGNSFDYFLLEDHFAEQYVADNRFNTVFGIFAMLAILVACLGLFGLASFTSSQRKKEIGVRKVLGASVVSILRLLYKEFSLLIVIAFIVAIPLAWYSMNLWLQSYAFKTSIKPTFFIIPFVLIVVISVITISFQAIKAALTNPTESLRSE
ncbi:MAG: ABC transporter permease [Flavobacteriales bacterium]